MPINSHDQTSILGSQIFDPKNRFVEGRILSASEGIIKTLPIYQWPAGISNEDKLTVLSYMTAFGLSDEESPAKWATWMYTYIVLCFDSMVDLIKREGGREYTFHKLPVSLIKDILALSDNALEFEGSGENQEYARLISKLQFPSHFPALPRSPEMFPDVLAGCKTVQAVYGFCALLIFMAGKKINEKNVTTITERRPQNLIDTYGISENATHFLTGEGKMQSQAHKMCNQAWVTYAFARRAIITDVAAFASGNSLPQRVVYTVSKLLENVGMQSAYYIHRFLQAFPECKEYTCIRPALGVYAASIREVAKADSRIQPYYKVIHGDLTRAFHRNGLLTLAACAISFEKTTSPSMRNFALGEGATTAVNMFDAEASSKNNRTLSEFTNVVEDTLTTE
nr:hypothetical protein [Plasmopara viticola lesion associated mononegaambi virus 5]